MNNKPINEYTDLELCEVVQQLYQQLIQTQGNIQIINQEISHRKALVAGTPPLTEEQIIPQPEEQPTTTSKKE